MYTYSGKFDKLENFAYSPENGSWILELLCMHTLLNLIMKLCSLTLWKCLYFLLSGNLSWYLASSSLSTNFFV